MSVPPRPVPASVNGWSPEFLEERYRAYRDDPSSVEPDLRSFFQGFDLASAGELVFSPGSGSGTKQTQAGGFIPATREVSDTPVRITPGRGQPAGQATYFQAVVDDLVDAYRDHGHLVAQIDPFDRPRPRPETLSLEYHGLTEADLGRTVDGSGLGLGSAVPLRDVIARLEETFCSTLGVEFMHIQDVEQRGWLFDRYESIGGRVPLDRARRLHILEQLVKSELFENFLAKRYPGEKRFSLEGAESLIPLMGHLLETGSDLGVTEVVLGMAHRGRLNVLNNVLGKTYQQIFTEFEETWEQDFVEGGGDVKYHQGYSGTQRYPNGKMLHLAMASNPSHLEAVGGVVEGRCRAKQRLRCDTERREVIPVLIHGDAAIIGQGVVQEILNYSQLEGYTTGGTVHIVVNNLIGFTTTPEDGRSSRYCTDIGKMIDAPIMHVNGEDPEAVATAAQLAMEYRQKFRRDVFIDMVCYRRYGHNEQDETSFTQPVMAKLIKGTPSVLTKYSQKLLGEGVIQEPDMLSIRDRIDETLEKAQTAVRENPNDPSIDPGSERWAGQTHRFSFEPADTAVTTDMLAEVCAALGSVPEGFKLNPKLKNLMKGRASLLDTKEISYADAETLAYGTLLVEGHPVRLSGQDCRRGTFSHRHAVVRDVETGEPHVPLNHIREMGVIGSDAAPGTPGADGKPRQANFCIYDSPLSEAGILGFEYGYSLADPSMLVLWEAQFGDFCNGAQVIIDQFIASAEAKWDRWSGLTLLLPHGYEGAGPEHSSARMERFLKLCGANDNLQVCYPSSAAQTFHMLRRQVKRNFRKPLIVMTPKSMLRIATSSIDELSAGGFHEFLDDPMFAKEGADRKKVKQVTLCCGKIYWELDKRRRELGRTDVALLRVEQVHPFHAEMLRKMLGQYPEAAERVYVQEEPYNSAAYLFMNNKCETELGMKRLRYIGRPSSATPATGSKRMHKHEQEAIITEAIGPKPDASKSGGTDSRKLAASA
ncbi:MAG: 2-oxoglutarate dehydrogenase subunit E1 [Phycisphaeraceae bacterium]|nr:MAG: 2-oxoglutarate dehydrogenase subunit E1 [Phycisphaeraceae bacterium]